MDHSKFKDHRKFKKRVAELVEELTATQAQKLKPACKSQD